MANSSLSLKTSRLTLLPLSVPGLIQLGIGTLDLIRHGLTEHKQRRKRGVQSISGRIVLMASNVIYGSYRRWERSKKWLRSCWSIKFPLSPWFLEVATSTGSLAFIL